MSETENKIKDFIGYEYKEITVSAEHASRYLDGFACFGWGVDDNFPTARGMHHTTIQLKRDRKIINKMELTRLQRQFEACLSQIDALEKAKHKAAGFWALVVGIVGTIFMAGSTFAVTNQPPIIWLCVLLAIPGFVGWIVPYFLHRSLLARQSRKVQPMIEAKQEEIYAVCEKGNSLL